MWRQRGVCNLSSIKIRHSQIEEMANRNKSGLSEGAIIETLATLTKKVEELTEEVKKNKNTVIIESVKESESEVKKEIEHVPMFIPTLNIEDKVMNETSVISVKKRNIDIDSTLNQLAAIKKETF